MTKTAEFVVLGAGVAGLTIVRQMTEAGRSVILVERNETPGGLARTFRRDGFSFDLGGHRFHSNNPDVVAWLRRLVGGDLQCVARRSRIYLNNRFLDYPIRLPQAMGALGPVKALSMAGSYLAALARNGATTDGSFEGWVVRRFGRGLFEIYFKPYTEKVWGLPCSALSSDWASQRIGLPSLTQAVYRALVPGRTPPATIIPHFLYPRSGYGVIPDRLADEVASSGRGTILTNTTVGRVWFSGDEAIVEVGDSETGSQTLRARHVISTIPLQHLLGALSDDSDIAALARDLPLAYRGILLVLLALDRPTVSADSWTYFPDRALLFGRTHEPKNWSGDMVPSPGVTSLAVEVFCSPGDATWTCQDGVLVDRAVGDLERVGWVRPGEVAASWVLRVPEAYPIYRCGYRDHLRRVTELLRRWPGLSLAGRTGSFRYMNVDGIVEECFGLCRRLGLHRDAGVQPLERDAGRWI